MSWVFNPMIWWTTDVSRSYIDNRCVVKNKHLTFLDWSWKLMVNRFKENDNKWKWFHKSCKISGLTWMTETDRLGWSPNMTCYYNSVCVSPMSDVNEEWVGCYFSQKVNQETILLVCLILWCNWLWLVNTIPLF